MATNAYQIWLTFDGEKQKLRFPVHPEKIKLKQGAATSPWRSSGWGRSNHAGEAGSGGLLEQFLPGQPLPWDEVSSLTWPEEIKNKIKTWMGSKSLAT